MDANAIREVLRARPFQPFRMRLADGSELAIAHPELAAVAPNGRRVVVFDPRDDSMTILEPLLILAVELGATNPGSAGGNGSASPS